MLPASGGLFDLDALDESIAENEQKMAEPGFWDDTDNCWASPCGVDFNPALANRNSGC